MAATATDVRSLSLTVPGEFDGYTDDQIAGFLTDAAMFIEGVPAGPKYDRAHALLAAHLLLQVATGGTTPAVVSESLGPASRTYAKPTETRVNGPLGLHATRYGQLYAALFETFVTTPIVVFDGTVPLDRWDY